MIFLLCKIATSLRCLALVDNSCGITKLKNAQVMRREGTPPPTSVIFFRFFPSWSLLITRAYFFCTLLTHFFLLALPLFLSLPPPSFLSYCAKTLPADWYLFCMLLVTGMHFCIPFVWTFIFICCTNNQCVNKQYILFCTLVMVKNRASSFSLISIYNSSRNLGKCKKMLVLEPAWV